MATQQVHWRDVRPPRPRQCFTAGGYPKLRFDDRHQAKVAARSLARKGLEGLQAYKCPVCGYFHVGNER